MAMIHIEWLTDWSDCETCGPSSANGAVVSVDGEEVIDLQPAAACYDGTSHEAGEVFQRLLEHLGHTVTYETVTVREADGAEYDEERIRIDGQPVPECEPEGCTEAAIQRVLERLGHNVSQSNTEIGGNEFDEDYRLRRFGI